MRTPSTWPAEGKLAAVLDDQLAQVLAARLALGGRDLGHDVAGRDLGVDVAGPGAEALATIGAHPAARIGAWA